MAYGNIGKPRSKFGRYIDSKGITQQQLVNTRYVSINIVTKACNKEDGLTETTKKNLVEAINKLAGENKKVSDFW